MKRLLVFVLFISLITKIEFVCTFFGFTKAKDDYSISVDNNSDIFNDDDVDIFDFSLRDTKEKLIEIMGEPDSIESIYAGAIGDYVFDYYYNDFGIVSLMPFISNPAGYGVMDITITNEIYIGPRETRIGDNYKDVIDKFYYDDNIHNVLIYDDEYLYDNGDETYGKLFYDESGDLKTIVYNYTVLDNEGSFIGEGCYLRYDITDDFVSYIRIGLLYLV